MSCSQKFIRLHIKTAVFLTRFAGWLQSGDTTKNKPSGELRKAKILTDYFTRKYLPVTAKLEQEQITVETPETIWQFWDNPPGRSTPAIVKAALESVNRFKGEFEHKVLNHTTIGDYSDLPGYVLDKFKKGQISHTHFSDLLRLNLLKNHGGIWLDATAYMTDFIPAYIVDEDFFVFSTGRLTHFPYSFMQNCFIRAKKGSLLCDAWYRVCIEFWKDESETVDYFQHQLMFKALVSNEPKAAKLFNNMPQHTEDGSQQLVGDNLLKKFDANEWERIKHTSFFQKTTYKVPGGVEYAGTYFSELSKGKL